MSEPSAQEQRIRALLASLRADDPMPDDVAERLEDTLARLAADRARTPDSTGPDPRSTGLRRQGPVAPLRRRAGRGLVAAAAALAVGGIALSQWLGGSGDLTAADSGGALRATPETALAQSPAPADDVPGAAGEELTGRAPGAPTAVAKDLPRLRAAHFAADARRLLADPARLERGALAAARDQASPDAAQSESQDKSQLRSDTGGSSAACAAPPHRADQQVLLIRLGGDPATLVADPVRADPRRVTAYACADAGVLRRATLR